MIIPSIIILLVVLALILACFDRVKVAVILLCVVELVARLPAR